MRGADVGRRNAIPFRIEPDFGQGPENVLEPSSNDAWGAFQDDERGS
jgi:hypothetical protein